MESPVELGKSNKKDDLHKPNKLNWLAVLMGGIVQIDKNRLNKLNAPEGLNRLDELRDLVDQTYHPSSVHEYFLNISPLS